MDNSCRWPEPADLESYRVQVAAATNLAVAYCATGPAEEDVDPGPVAPDA